ncbi:protein kinase [Streptomyces sp. SAJ15]|uniref:protein kinase n=1 Tax=Streptomyces sp. SAJ15 TaxID=2011095 RepID=UPI001184A506|nr:protein kinase [Streptomyces sp. SAJ15]TVL93709.1 serine/threonine protein kinase [Streptomyces sp. SAJ15]
MDDYAGRVLADRYRLPLPPSDEYELVETRAFDTYSGQEVQLRQIPLPEVVDAEVLSAGADGRFGAGPGAGGLVGGPLGRMGRSGARSVDDPLVRRAVEAATAAAALPDHPRLDQVFHVFVEDGSLWIVSEFVVGRPLAALLAERTLAPHRAAEIAADVLTALRALHAHGWVHRNITARTVLVCEDGRAMLTGLAAGAAEEALCGYDPVPAAAVAAGQGSGAESATGPGPVSGHGPLAFEADRGPAADPAEGPEGDEDEEPERDWESAGDDDREPLRAPRAGAIAAYRAGARAVAPDDRFPGEASAARPFPETGFPGAEPTGSPGAAAGAGAEGHGPAGALAAERARQARILVVGAVTERWAPEQAGPVHANWQLAPPVGPATDLWAVGALLFRAVQGHAPYPEESAAELVQLVCAEAPAYAEECGPLRPVVESLMRQEPSERPDVEELRGWLRSLIRSAPEPDVGSRTVVVPSTGAGGPVDPKRLPIVRRRGWLVRRGRGRGDAAAGVPPHGRHKRGRAQTPRAGRTGGDPREPRTARLSGGPREPLRNRESLRGREPRREREPRISREPRLGSGRGGSRGPRGARGPRHLGRILLTAILLLLAAVVLYAMLFMPEKEGEGEDRTGSTGTRTSAVPSRTTAGGEGETGAGPAGSSARQPQSTTPDGLAKGFVVRKDPKGFQIAVHEDWQRREENARGQIRYVDRGGDFELVVVAGRDKASRFGADPMAYQQDREPELAAFRESEWSSSSRLRRTDVGRTAMAEGAFSWRDSSGRQVYARNLAMLLDGRYHLVQVIGPDSERRAVARFFEQAMATYRTGGG